MTSENSATKGFSNLALKSNGTYELGVNIEGWTDRAKATKEEYRRQCEANEVFFVKEAPRFNLSDYIENIEDTCTFNITGLNAAVIVNLLRCVIEEYRTDENSGPFLFKFAEDKKFRLELLPTAGQPGNGLIRVVGKLKYYNYPEMNDVLHKAGVTNKGLGDMLLKLNIQGIRSALFNDISPINELHFMLLFEIARKLVQGPNGKPVSTNPAVDNVPTGLVISRMIELLRQNEVDFANVLSFEGQYNSFIEVNPVLKKKKIVLLNGCYHDHVVMAAHSSSEKVKTFLDEAKQNYVIKTLEGYLHELTEFFGSM